MSFLQRDGQAGRVLFEVYDVVPRNGSRVVKVGARHRVGAAVDDWLFAGFTIGGSGQKSVLVRGVGPGLALPPYNATAPLARATLSVFGSDGQLLADNDSWPPTLADLSVRVGATPLEMGCKDAAVALVLSPGTYLVGLRGSSGDSGEVCLKCTSSSRCSRPAL